MGFNNSTDFQDNYIPINNLYTKLTDDIDNVATVIPVESTSGFPPKGWISIGTEAIFYDFMTSTSFGDSNNPVERGADGTTAASHSKDNRVSQRINSAVFHEIMKSVKKRREYILSATEVTAGIIDPQNIDGFASRVRSAELRLIATGGSQNFYVEFYRNSLFKAIDRTYKTITLTTVEDVLSQDTSAGDGFLYVNDSSQFTVDEMVVIGDFPDGTYEYAVIKEIDDAANKITFFDPLANSYVAAQSIIQVNRDQTEFYYEDLDWLAQLHTRIVNNDTTNPVTVHFHFIAEVSDEA